MTGDLVDCRMERSRAGLIPKLGSAGEGGSSTTSVGTGKMIGIKRNFGRC